jgi:hypothetical protein
LRIQSSSCIRKKGRKEGRKKRDLDRKLGRERESKPTAGLESERERD